MPLDINNINAFYSSHLGLTTQRVIGKHIAEVWTEVRGMNVLGVGLSSPYLGGFQKKEAKNVLSAVPVAGKFLHRPGGLTKQCFFYSETLLPLPDLSMDRILIVHALEHVEAVRPFLREIWRVLSGNGRLMVITPNRRGIWAQFDRTPFGYGQPYSTNQLSKLLLDNMFTPTNSSGILCIPPSKSRVILSAAPALERIGQRFFHAISGVISVEASKEVYAGTLTGATSQPRVYSTITTQ